MFWYWLVLSLWTFWLLVYWRGGLDILQDIRAASTRLDLLYLVMLTVVTLSLVASGWWMALQAEAEHAFMGIGAGLTLLGAGGTFYCRRYLGTFWTAENVIQTNHRIVNTGPYALVRHPIYTAAIVLYLGTGLVFTTWWTALLTAIAILIYILKTAHEDGFLSTHLPGYAHYQQQVRYRLLPRVW